MSKKTKRIKARRCWLKRDEATLYSIKLSTHDVPVAVLDVSDPDALVTQAAQALGCYVGVGKQARAVLESLGIISPAKKTTP